jgi:hypothetical protein
MNKRTFGVVAVFLVGCAVGGVSSQLVVPKASAQQAATLTKWEYQCTTPGASITELANKLGAEGWELVTVRGRTGTVLTGHGDEDIYCFKRPKM